MKEKTTTSPGLQGLEEQQAINSVNYKDEFINGEWVRVRIECDHMCTSECRRSGCNCECGEYHNEENETN